MRRLIVTTASLVLVACSGPAEPPAGTPDAATPALEVNVYSARHYDSDRALYDAFEAETGISVRVREANAAQLLETVRAEGENSPADVLITADAGALWRFKEAGLTQPIASARVEDTVPARYRDGDGHWTGLALRARVVAYDPQAVSAEDIATLGALADERFDGEICVRSSSNIYNLSLLGEIILRDGVDAAARWAESLASNMARDPQGGDTAQIEAVAAGLCSIAIVNHYYWVRLATSSSQAQREVAAKTALAFPAVNGGVHVNVTGAAMARHAPSPEAARRFIEYLLSQEGQAMLVSETREFPIVEGVTLPAGLDTLPEFTRSDLDLGELGETQATAQRLFDRAGWN